MKYWILISLFSLFHHYDSNGQNDPITPSINNKKPFSHEYFLSGGYNYCKDHFLDLGFRYYRMRNDAQAIMAYGGVSLGCELALKNKDHIYIPYLGYQGHMLLWAYGFRSEFAISNDKKSLGFRPEIGFSYFEFLRITCGYRFEIPTGDAIGISGFRFSIIGALHLNGEY
ncbi:MAG: hypothetical protein ACK40G_09695 [Cytophagaceae bacterium]